MLKLSMSEMFSHQTRLTEWSTAFQSIANLREKQRNSAELETLGHVTGDGKRYAASAMSRMIAA
jgi:hypothetical protein